MDEKTKEYLVMCAINTGVLPIVLSFMAAPILLFWRMFVYLKDGFWLKSLCSVSYDIQERTDKWSGNGGFVCDAISTEWIGFNRLSQWLLQDIDVSLLMLGSSIIGAVIFFIIALTIAIINAK